MQAMANRPNSPVVYDGVNGNRVYPAETSARRTIGALLHAAPTGRKSIARGASPWFAGVRETVSPDGATVCRPSYCRPVGAYDSSAFRTRGLRPWLLTAAALRLKQWPLHNSAKAGANRWVTPVLILLAATALGCAGNSKNKWTFANLDPRSTLGWKKDEPAKPEPQVPTRLVATWTEAVLNTAGEKSKRGFGGRIAFFNRDSDDPVRVDGQLVVYAFDETARKSHETQPTRKYIFPADEVVRHESDSALGPAYSFWLPWDEVGGPQKNVSLIARFEPKGGPIVIGEQTRHFLPGGRLDAQPPQLARDHRADMLNGVRLASYADPAAEGAIPDLAEPFTSPGETSAASAGKKPMVTSTIPLPARLASALKEQPSHHAAGVNTNESASLPLSQLSTMRASGTLGPGEPVPVALPQTAVPSATAPAEAPRQTPSRPTAARRAAPGSLRDSLLATLPAQARQASQAANAPAR